MLKLANLPYGNYELGENMTAINDSGMCDMSVCFQKEVHRISVDSSSNSPQCSISVQI